MKNYLILFGIVALVMTTKPLSAAPIFSAAELSTPGILKDLELPPQADHSPVISLGTSIDPETGLAVEGYKIVHYKKAAARPGGQSKGSTVCYGYMAKGAKWKSVEPWMVNTSNDEGLDSAFVFNNLSDNITKWEDATDGVMNGLGLNVLGNGSTTTDALLADEVSPDNQNEVYFADVDSPGAIGVTIVWGIFGGPVGNRQLVEWDQIYDDVDFDWSDSGEASKMDFENIATHELGHSIGLADLYNSCVDETMYGYAGEGETNKRTLNSGDILGTNNLY